MRRTIIAVLVAAVFAPALLYSGQVYGTITADGQPLKGAKIEIQCGSESAIAAVTAPDGAYRMNVPEQGKCNLTLVDQTGKPSAVIFSSPNPSLFNFDLVKLPDGKLELRRKS
jgi:hypothetical protein